jgi:hypothetical protein
MESTTNVKLSSSQTSSKQRNLIPVSIYLGVLLSAGGVTIYWLMDDGRLSSKHISSNGVVALSPEDIAIQWMQSVNEQNWRREYECYTGSQQAAFTHKIVVCSRELLGAEDFASDLNQILRRFNVPNDLLDKYPSLRLDLSNMTNRDEIALAVEKQSKLRRQQLLRWESEVQTLDVDWAGLIEELQPLFVESLQRHQNDDHPSSSGLAYSLGYYTLDEVRNISVVGNLAEGSAIAIIRDPKIMPGVEMIEERTTRPVSISSIGDWISESLGFQKPVSRCLPEKITFKKVADGWRIDSAPFR